MSEFKIKTLKTDSLSRVGEFKVVNLYPKRTFKEERHVILWKKETFGTYQYFYNFYECDKQDIKVVMYCTSLLLPVASLIAHEIRMHDSDLSKMYSAASVGVYGFDRKSAWNTFNLNTVGGWHLQNPAKEFHTFDRTFKKVFELFDFYRTREMLIDEDSLSNWNGGVCDKFDSGKVNFEIKKVYYPKVFELIKSKFKPIEIGLDKSFQKALIEECNGSKFLLSYQILSSVLKGCRYVSFGGAANLMNCALPIKQIISGERNDYQPEQMVLFKNLFMKYFYGEQYPNLNSLTDRYNFNSNLSLETLENFLSNHLPSNNPAKNITICQ